MNVTAKDNSTGRSNQIQIKNDKGRLSKEEIDRMLRDAEKYKAEDDVQRERVAAKNKLEMYAFSVKQSLDDAKNLSSQDKNTAEEACNKELRWLDSNQEASKDELEYHYNQLSKICSPIMTKIYKGNSSGSGYAEDSDYGRGRGSGYGGGRGSSYGGGNRGPTVEEVD